MLVEYIFPAVFVAAIVAYSVHSMRKAAHARAQIAQAGPGISEQEDFRQIVDRTDPARGFGQACFFISMGGDDYGYYPKEAPRTMLKSSWDITDRNSALQRIERLLSDPHQGDDAELVFDRVRAMFLARSSAGAEYIGQDESWGLVARAGRDLQARIPSFEYVGAHYTAKAQAWCAANGVPDTKTALNVAKLRTTLWQHVRYDVPLTT